MTQHIHVRGHHLLCLHFYRGEGYDDAFVDNLWSIVEALDDATIEVADGADDICSACPDLLEGECTSEDVGEEMARRLDDLALELIGCAPGDVVVWAAVRGLLPRVLPVWRASACRTCDWREICAPIMDLESR